VVIGSCWKSLEANVVDPGAARILHLAESRREAGVAGDLANYAGLHVMYALLSVDSGRPPAPSSPKAESEL